MILMTKLRSPLARSMERIRHQVSGRTCSHRVIPVLRPCRRLKQKGGGLHPLLCHSHCGRLIQPTSRDLGDQERESMKTNTTMLCTILFLMAALCETRGQGTNSFSTNLDARWATHDASNVISFVVDQYQSNTNDPKRAFARGIVAVFAQHWCRGGSNYIARACDLLSVATNFPPEIRTVNTGKMRQLISQFGQMADGFNEPVDSGPVCDTNDLAVLFIAWPSSAPYSEIIKELDLP